MLCDELVLNLSVLDTAFLRDYFFLVFNVKKQNPKKHQTQTVRAVLMLFNVLCVAERCMKGCRMCIIDSLEYSVDYAQQKGTNGNICSSLITLRVWLTFEEKSKQQHAIHSQPWHLEWALLITNSNGFHVESFWFLGHFLWMQRLFGISRRTTRYSKYHNTSERKHS